MTIREYDKKEKELKEVIEFLEKISDWDYTPELKKERLALLESKKEKLRKLFESQIPY